MTEQPQQINLSLNRTENYESGKTSPTPKKTKKNFQKIFRKEHKDDEGQSKNKELNKQAKADKTSSSYEDAELKLEAYAENPKSKRVSLFDLASNEVKDVEPDNDVQETTEAKLPVKDKQDQTISGISSEMHEMSLSALFKGYGTKEKLQFIQEEVKPLSKNMAKTEMLASKKSNLPLSRTSFPQRAYQMPSEDLRKPVDQPFSAQTKKEGFPQEQLDIAGVNPNTGLYPPIQTVSNEVQAKEPAAPQVRVQELQKIVDQIVNKISMVASSGKTDTLITLQHPPLFAGSNVVISSFDSAKGEFNISFENLTQAAQKIIVMQENQNALKSALEQKGYMVHIITATTQPIAMQIAEGQASNEQSGERENKDSQKHHNQEQNKE